MLKTLGAQVKQYRWVTFITPVFSALEAVADMFLPMLMSRIIDKGVKVGGQAGMQAVLHYGAIMVAVAIGALVCGILAGRFGLDRLDGLRGESAAGHVCQHPELFVLQHRPLLHGGPCYAPDDRRQQRAALLSDDHAYLRARACHAHHGAHHGIFHSRQPEHDLRRGYRDPGGLRLSFIIFRRRARSTACLRSTTI